MNGVKELEITGRKLHIRESYNTCEQVTGRALTGSWLWESAVILSEWMAANRNHHLPDQFDRTSKTVLELGAGTGLSGITAAAVLGADDRGTDIVGPLLDGIRTKEVKELVCRATIDDEEHWNPVDVVLMADLFYDLKSCIDIPTVFKMS